jgi:2-isopropylmalate synthase
MKKQKHIEIFDTTLRDGSQGEDVSLTLRDQIILAQKMDEFGVDYIEGGWPGALNPKVNEFFKAASKLKFKNAQLVAFGSTRRAKNTAANDPGLKDLLATPVSVFCIFGKCWDLHVKDILKVSFNDNLKMIGDSVRFLKQRKKEVLFDAEHFFDGYKANPAYALNCLQAAYDAKADCLVLCDTNGGSMPWEIEAAVMEVRKLFGQIRLGIHVHNDCELAVANSLAAVRQGVTHIQGTINGYGERCGNANLISIIANLSNKMFLNSIPLKNVPALTRLAREFSSIVNVPLNDHQAYVGLSAFAHKAGVHADAVIKCPSSYEHITPESVGNERRLLASEQAGKATILAKARQYGLPLKGDSEKVREIVSRVKTLENEGYQFEGADASLELMMRRYLGLHKNYFTLLGYHVGVERSREETDNSEATIKLLVKNKIVHTVSEGSGPVNALDNALRKALLDVYPVLAQTSLMDYKVRVLQIKEGTAAKVRVQMETTDGKMTWNTVGVNQNVIEASWEALADSIKYKLTRDGIKP